MPPNESDRYADSEYAMDLLRAGDIPRLEEFAALDDSFPVGFDSSIGCRWIIHAIDSGTVEAVRWVLGRNVELRFREQDGSTPLHSALERADADRHAILRLLLERGADTRLKGVNDYTPAHLAAAGDDVEALKILVEFGADLSIRTIIDDCATPLEEAERLGSGAAVAYLKTLT